ncbi:uncharacterized protein LOC111411479 [Olea europaea var. sylvestris]|uniref:uncharacterized protein LOC111411479 n=1 Tax=Olea europaea var. sylvestris TaxID=158386 RepID=UPI000C1CFA77|nr:uncharacterized protein LOC111411479 [Olea europaea var. sylvestris]
MDPKACLSIHEGDLLPDASHYRCLIGRLINLTLSRPDITYVVHKLSQFLSQPQLPHLKAIHQLFHYLNTTVVKVHSFQHPYLYLSLQAFTDAHCGSCIDTRNSTTKLGDSLISLNSKRLPKVSCSSTEAEYRALAVTISDLLWIT